MRIPALLLALTLTHCCDANEVQTNAAHAYQIVFTNLQSWSAPGAESTEVERSAAYDALMPLLSPLRTIAPGQDCDWGTRFEDGFAAILPECESGRKAGKALCWAAGQVAERDPDQAVRHLVDCLRLARHIGGNGFLISYLVQMAMEQAALEPLAQIIHRLDESDLRVLRTTLAQLPAGADLDLCMETERTVGIDQLTRDVLDALHRGDTNLFIVPDAVSRGQSSTRGDPHPFEHLRLAAIVDAGADSWIGFERPDGSSFQVFFRKPCDGIELLSIDPSRWEALVVRERQTALLRLQSKSIEPIDLRLRLPAPGEPSTAGGTLGPLIDLIRANLDASPTTGIPRTATDLLAVLETVSAEFDELRKALRTKHGPDLKAWYESFTARCSPLGAMLFPALIPVREKQEDRIARWTAFDAELARLIAERSTSGN